MCLGELSIWRTRWAVHEAGHRANRVVSCQSHRSARTSASCRPPSRNNNNHRSSEAGIHKPGSLKLPSWYCCRPRSNNIHN
ncbi:unnamed protein product [Pleuronectes platessa]|uniref:Uncharacterized protein n=1 Tax=Pleuronectes platessa TaxID=8262 RepID=A0A9N7V409_PLEPL|nr:unnamed protein product [Pleuronectes platessa]